MIKYELIPEQLLYEGTITSENLFHPSKMEEDIILKTHTKAFWHKLKTQTLSAKEIRKIGFPMTHALVERGRHIAQGTLDCAKFAMEHGCALNVAGGTHHSYANHGEGFCVFNDFALASNYLLNNKLVKQILIIDLDVHQGNGTAHIFANNSRVFTFSAHGAKNYPVRKEKSDLDVGFPDQTSDNEYLQTITKIIPELIEKVKPDLIFYLSGVDVLDSDKLGRLSLSMKGCKERDTIVLENCFKHQIPVAVSMGGGYSEKIADIIEAHANTFRTAQSIFE